MNKKTNSWFKYVVIIAVLLVPFMYSFFYLKAYWNPYGKGNIDNLPVAVVNKDSGDKGKELIDNIKTKRFTYNKLNRMFLHILFNIKKDQKYDINYIRVLGFNLKGRLYLKTIKDDLDTLIITNYKDIDDEVLKIERRITILYLQIIKREDLIKEELKSIPIKIN